MKLVRKLSEAKSPGSFLCSILNPLSIRFRVPRGRWWNILVMRLLWSQLEELLIGYIGANWKVRFHRLSVKQTN